MKAMHFYWYNFTSPFVGHVRLMISMSFSLQHQVLWCVKCDSVRQTLPFPSGDEGHKWWGSAVTGEKEENNRPQCGRGLSLWFLLVETDYCQSLWKCGMVMQCLSLKWCNIYWWQVSHRLFWKCPYWNHAAQLASTHVHQNKPPHSHQKNPRCRIEDVGWIFLSFFEILSHLLLALVS